MSLHYVARMSRTPSSKEFTAGLNCVESQFRPATHVHIDRDSFSLLNLDDSEHVR